MTSLWYKYNRLIESKEDNWYYYTRQDSCKEDIKEYRKNLPYSNNDNANNFLCGYFKAGDKQVLDICNDTLSDSKTRDLHSVSLYFLGLCIAREMGVSKFTSRERTKDCLNEPCYKHLLFEWFMTCLYHDVGYCFEENPNLSKDISTFLSFIDKYNVIKYGEDSIFYGDPDLYNLCDGYYRYKYNRSGKLDHGITGGILLYDSLVKNYRRVQSEPDNCKYKDFCCGNLFFSPSLFVNYKNAATAIIKHNMWIADSDTLDYYIDNNLDRLIPIELDSRGKFEKISIEKDKLLFLLCLADTLEPLKVFVENPINVLQHVKFDISKKVIKIEVDSSLDSERYFKKIEGLTSWMNVEVVNSNNLMDETSDKNSNYDLKIVLVNNT